MAFEPELIGLVLLFLAGGGKKAAARPAPRPTSSTPAGGGPEPPSHVGPDGEALMKRANQPAALDWIHTFEGQGLPLDYSEALARWAGIESSGDPLAVSKLGERGLLQLGAASQQEGALEAPEWAALVDPSTSREQHAHMAMELATWCYNRALRYIADPPPLDDHVSAAFYGKLYHQRPVDVRDGKLHGEAHAMARELAKRWAGDDAKMHRLRAANVVAFGVPNP